MGERGVRRDRRAAAVIRALLAAVLLLAAALGWSLWRAEVHKSDATEAVASRDAAQHEAGELRNALATERQAAKTMTNIGSEHEADRRDAEGVPAAVGADLRAGNLRLRRELAGCATDRVSLAGAAAFERDAAAEVREQIAGDLVRVARDADDHVRACQAVVEADRGGSG